MELVDRKSLSDITGRTHDYMAASAMAYSVLDHGYDPDVLAAIAERAHALQSDAHCEYLSLQHVRGVHTRIPEVDALMTDTRRLAALSEVAGVPLEPYPITPAASHINFYEGGGTSIDFHTDGAAFVELIPVEITGAQRGGQTMIYRGSVEAGKNVLAAGGRIADEATVKVPHAVGRSVLLQGRRLLHAAQPLREGTRVTLVLVMRSKAEPWKDDNSIMRLMLDDPYEEVIDEWLRDVRERKYPSFRAATSQHF